MFGQKRIKELSAQLLAVQQYNQNEVLRLRGIIQQREDLIDELRAKHATPCGTVQYYKNDILLVSHEIPPTSRSVLHETLESLSQFLDESNKPHRFNTLGKTYEIRRT